MTKITGDGWILTDPSFDQYGRKITEMMFEFKQKDIHQRLINLNYFTLSEMEEALNSFGHTLFTKNECTNVFREYKGNAFWIIAECLFELEIKPESQ